MATIKTPLERHLYVADLDDGPKRAPVALTAGDGWDNVTMTTDTKRFLLGYSDPAQPPQISLHDDTGRRLDWLVENRIDANHPYAPYLDRHVLPEFGTIPPPTARRSITSCTSPRTSSRASAIPPCCWCTAARPCRR
jgi:dipeptidyl-peptidase-4